jgi:hypothetical protein
MLLGMQAAAASGTITGFKWTWHGRTIFYSFIYLFVKQHPNNRVITSLNVTFQGQNVRLCLQIQAPYFEAVLNEDLSSIVFSWIGISISSLDPVLWPWISLLYLICSLKYSGDLELFFSLCIVQTRLFKYRNLGIIHRRDSISSSSTATGLFCSKLTLQLIQQFWWSWGHKYYSTELLLMLVAIYAWLIYLYIRGLIHK